MRVRVRVRELAEVDRKMAIPHLGLKMIIMRDQIKGMTIRCCWSSSVSEFDCKWRPGSKPQPYPLPKPGAHADSDPKTEVGLVLEPATLCKCCCGLNFH